MKSALLMMTFVQGLGAGICFDIATVKLPTRQLDLFVMTRRRFQLS